MTVFAPHYSQISEKPAVSTAVGVGSKGIRFPLDNLIGKIHIGGHGLRHGQPFFRLTTFAVQGRRIVFTKVKAALATY